MTDLLRASTSLPVVSNELGLFVPVEVYDRNLYVRAEMVRKLIKGKYYLDRFALWFSVRGEGPGIPAC